MKHYKGSLNTEAPGPLSVPVTDEVMCSDPTVFMVLSFNILQFHYSSMIIPLAGVHVKGILQLGHNYFFGNVSLKIRLLIYRRMYFRFCT